MRNFKFVFGFFEDQVRAVLQNIVYCCIVLVAVLFRFLIRKVSPIFEAVICLYFIVLDFCDYCLPSGDIQTYLALYVHLVFVFFFGKQTVFKIELRTYGPKNCRILQ